MASALVDEILQDMELLGRDVLFFNPLEDLQIGLRHMRTFLLLARKWHKDARSRSDDNTSSSSLVMGSFLNRLEESLIKVGKNFHFCFLAQKNEILRIEWDLLDRAIKLKNCIYSFREGIAESYITLLEYYPLRSKDQLLEFIDSLQVNLASVRYQCRFDEQPIEVESLREKVLLIKNFIRFAQLRGFEPRQLQFLFTHVQLVTVNAARLCHDWTFLPYGDKKRLRGEFRLKFYELLLKTRLVDPQIRETCVQVLNASKFSGLSHVLTLGTDRHVLGDFVDSLLYNILEALADKDSYMVSLKDQVPMLYEGLIFLRTILTNHLEKIDELHEKMKDLIGAVVNEAAIVTCSPPVHKLEEELAKDMDIALLNLLEKLKLIKLITSSLIFPRTNEHDFVDFSLENLKELASCKADSIAYAKDQIQRVQEDLASLRLYFLESDLDQRNRDGKLQSLWSRVAEVAYKTWFAIESLVVGDIFDCSTSDFNLIEEKIYLIKTEAMEIDENATKNSAPSPSQGSTPTINKTEVAFDDEVDTIIREIIEGPKQLDIISIVGMPGIGKTSLAKSVYEDPSVRYHFHARAWCIISQVNKKKDLLLQILGFVDRDFSDDNYSKKDDYELEEKLKKCLLRKRYLIVLDDVWDIDAWSGLARLFPDDANSSRILLTTRDSDVAKRINPDREPYLLRLRSVEESWHLMQKKLYWHLMQKELSCEVSYPLNLGMKIAKNCKGLPLTIIIVAGILANLEQKGWEEIAKRLSSSDLSIIDQCMNMIEVSYQTLPEYLRSCFLYFGAFREDKEIPCKRLIWLWIAEGFVQRCEHKSLEDVAEDYMNDLISRNLVIVCKERSTGGAKTCRIHDLLHEFCVVRAKKVKFMSVLSGHNELSTFHGQRDLQRLCIHSASEDLEKSSLFCPSVRSLLFFADGNYSYHFKYCRISFIFHFFKLLEVLDLTNINLGITFPCEIALLVELRYLAIRGHSLSIPPEVANLLDLETVLIYACRVFLPDTIWNLPKLRVLQSNGLISLDSGLMPTNLCNLDTLSILYVSYSQLEKILRKLPNIRKLKCGLLEGSGESNADCKSIVGMDWLSQLESLHLNRCGINMGCIGFRFPLNIKKLTVSQFNSSIIPKRGELPNLEVLKLHSIYFEGNTWDMNEDWQFPKLKLLEMDSLTIARWSGCDDVDHFPCLEKLVVHNCMLLKEVPYCLEDIAALQMIEVRDCGFSAARLFQMIKEQHMYWGNDIVLLIENWEDESSENEDAELTVEDESSENEDDELTVEDE